MELGIQRQSRQYVHLSMDFETALTVCKRHGKPIVLRINSEAMVDNGHKFYLSKNGVWLTKDVPVKFISIETDRNV